MAEILSVQEFKQLPLDPPAQWCVKKKNRTNIFYHPDVITFDTEFTSIIKNNPKKIEAYGLLYLWQACIFGHVVMGRNMQEFVELIAYIKDVLNLNQKKRVICYVHNLECDFMYLQGYFKKWDVFAPSKRAVLTAFAEGIEFRCSYKLTNMSLAKFLSSENVQTQKQSGEDFDYKKLRTPDTVLSDEELYYAYCDVRGLYEAINSLMRKNGDNTATIPLTSTGYVRRDCRNNMLKKYNNWEQFRKMKLNGKQYMMFKDAFRGGNTHANRYHAGHIVDDMQSFDIASSYPSVMLYEKYPAGPCIESNAKTLYDLDEITKNGDGYIVNITFTNLRTTAVIPYIPIAKVVLDSIDVVSNGYVVNDNGRLLYAAGETTMNILDIDLRIIRDTYEWDEIKINQCYYYRMNYLPIEFRETISDYFVKKTTLKNVEGQEYFYTKSKNKLNGCYGMCVTDPVHFNILLNEGQWIEEIPSDLEGFYEEGLKHFYRSKNNFLAYQWGVYVTAYARARLQEAIDICGLNMVYCDTDSVKFIRSKEISDKIYAINNRITQKALNSEVKATAQTIKGEQQTLGLWDEEKPYKKFITYGAKKYAYYYDDDILHITVSGLSKSAASEIGTIENFVPGLTVQNSGRTIAVYDDNIKPHILEVDGKEYEIRGNMAIVDTTYTLGITDLYDSIINNKEYKKKKKINNKTYIFSSSIPFDPE